MRISELGSRLLVCFEKDEAFLSGEIRANVSLRTASGICVFSIPSNLQECLFKILHLLPPHQQRPYLGKFFIWTSFRSGIHQERLWTEFYELISDEYELLVDSSRNKENIANLISIIEQKMGKTDSTLILDYGCGTGVAQDVIHRRDIRLIGVEKVNGMRKQAQTRNLEVWSHEEFTQQPNEIFDAAFASYVFHLLATSRGLDKLWDSLKSGGVLVANFHNDQGIDLICKFMKKNGGTFEAISLEGKMERHGTYMAFKKLHR